MKSSNVKVNFKIKLSNNVNTRKPFEELLYEKVLSTGDSDLMNDYITVSKCQHI
jgi:hypothetical protein